MKPYDQFVSALTFLTRFEVGNGGRGDGPDDRNRTEKIGRSIAFFPVVGLVLGCVLCLVAFVGRADFFNFPPAIAAIAIVAALALLTGGLHLDGVADLADGIGGGRGDRARTLEIMRDSRIGTFGVVALVLLLGAKFVALTALLGSEASPYWTILAFPAVGRWAVGSVILFMPSARTDGLGLSFNSSARGQDQILASIAMFVIILFGGLGMLIPALFAGASALALGAWARARLGGVTGDVYGAAIEAGELAFLIALIAIA